MSESYYDALLDRLGRDKQRIAETIRPVSDSDWAATMDRVVAEASKQGGAAVSSKESAAEDEGDGENSRETAVRRSFAAFSAALTALAAGLSLTLAALLRGSGVTTYVPAAGVGAMLVVVLLPGAMPSGRRWAHHLALLSWSRAPQSLPLQERRRGGGDRLIS